MDDEYVVEEISDDDYCSSSSEDELQNFIKRECGLLEIKDDFEAEVDKVMTAHLRKLNSSKEETTDDDSKVTPEAGTSQTEADKQKAINDDLLYDPDMDDDDERWVNAKRRSYMFPSEKKEDNVKLKPLPNSDAVLNCPACLSLLCLDCQRHDVYKNQYRAMFVSNCKVVSDEVLKYPHKKKRSKKHSEGAVVPHEDAYNPVRCSICNTEVAVYDKEEIYHFFNVLASY